MADVFGDPGLFGEFEKDRSYADDHSKRRVEEARAYLSTLCSPLKHNTLVTEKGLNVSGDARADTGIPTADGNNFPDTSSAMEYIQKLESEIQQLKQINEKLLLEKRPANPKSFEMAVDGPVVQLLFINNTVACKYRSKVENCLKDMFSQETVESFRASKLPYRSEVVGSYQYYKGFVLDVSGWPLPDHSSSLIDSWNLPKYEQVFRQSLPCEQLTDKETPEVVAKEKRAKAACFNCGGDHNVSACMEQRDQQRINQARRQFMDKFSPSVNNPSKQRYHIEDDPRFSDMMPGTISDVLRDALGISTQQLPPYIYQMRVLGYPPGHLENAKQSTSGLTMFDKHGQELTSDGELLEDGEVNEAFVQSRSPIPKLMLPLCTERPAYDQRHTGTEPPEAILSYTDKGRSPQFLCNSLCPTAEYNFDKLVDYPGFNVGLPAGTIDESGRLGMPPMQPQWNKNAMKDILKFTKQKLRDVHGKRKLDDVSYRDGARKCLKTDAELETTVDMDIEETTGDETCSDQLSSHSPWPIVSMPIMHQPPPPPPLPEDLEEELPPLPLEPSPGGSSGLEFCAEPSTTSEPQSEAEAAGQTCSDSLSNRSSNSDKDPNKQPDCTARPPASLQPTKMVTPVGGRFGGASRSFCLGTPLALQVDDSPLSAKGLPDSSKFASGVSDLIYHENLPNATGTFNRLKVFLTDVKNRSSPSTNASLKQ